MENTDKDKSNVQIPKNGLAKVIKTSLEWCENITTLDLRNKNIKYLDDSIKFPAQLKTLNLSQNRLKEVPDAVLNLQNLEFLDISHNEIIYFDVMPKFVHSIQYLSLAQNRLKGPPYWVWAESPHSLKTLDISRNWDISSSFENSYFEELLQYNTKVSEVHMYSCKLWKYFAILSTFQEAKVLDLGYSELLFAANDFDEVPCKGLDMCKNIQKLNLCNTGIHKVNQNIDIYKYLREINLSNNNIYSLPKEFGNLENLEVCILSFNYIIYLPESMINLRKLIRLYIDNNELCVIDENLCTLPNLYTLDLYNNKLYEVPTSITNIQDLDLAQNYFDEPEDDYLEKKERLRLNILDRMDGRKFEDTRSESENSPDTSDDEEYLSSVQTVNDENIKESNERSSSPEDWDSDDYWVPHFYRHTRPLPHSSWLYFVKQKMEEGNFCPMDAHTVSIAEKVKYEKMCNPIETYESDGQFDDYSGDDS